MATDAGTTTRLITSLSDARSRVRQACLQLHRSLLSAAIDGLEERNVLSSVAGLYRRDAVWLAPRRRLRVAGSAQIVASQWSEFRTMRDAVLTSLRATGYGSQLIDEYSVRFQIAAGIAGVDLPGGAPAELHRIRILSFEGELIRREVCIETWTVLDTPEGPSARQSNGLGD